MKVFAVITERCKEDNKEIVNVIKYVTSAKDTLLSVTEYFTQYCEEYEEDLKSVKEVITVVQHIP